MNTRQLGWSGHYQARLLNAPCIYVDPETPDTIYCKPEDVPEVVRIMQGIIDGRITIG